MKQLYYILVLFFLIFSVNSAKAQAPANDSICNAQNLGTLPAPPSCGGATSGTKKGTVVTVTGTNVNATPELTYPYNPNCPPNLTNPPADVWYSFVASSYQTVIAITGATFANPIITVWQGTCTGYASIGCVSGTAGAASLTVIALTPGNTYYVQVSGLDGTQTGTYTMKLTSETDCSNCLVASKTTATPPPTNGYYKPNTTVTFCDSIYNWDQTSANWLHGVQWTFGAGWNQATLVTSTVAITPTSGSCSQDGGYWAWYPNGTTSSATGTHFGAGYYYETSSGSTSGTIDNDPGDNYGDDDVNNCTWKFCVTITTNAACTPGSNLDVSIDVTGDGQSGSWTSPACANDPVTDLYAVGSCCPPTMSSTPATCANANAGTATATPDGTNSPWTFAWSNGVTQTGLTGPSTITGLAQGIDTVTVTDALNCTVSATVTIGGPANVNAGPNQTICQNATATMAATGTGSWTAAAGNPANVTFTAPSSATSTVTGFTLAGTYTLQWTNSTGCMATTEVTVNALPTPTVNSPTICAGQSATLTTSGGGTYAWSPTTNMTPPAGNTASVTVTPTATTTYDVTVTTAAGCSASASGTVTVNPLPTPTVNSPGMCAGTSATLTTSGGGTYAWSPTTNMTPPAGNTASVTVTPTATTTYDVTVTSAAGCSATASGTVTVNPLPTPTVNSPSMCAGTSATLTTSGGGTYAWSPTTNMTPPAGNTASVTVTPGATTTYDVTVTTAAGCSASASGTVTVNTIAPPTVNNATICAGQSATLTTSGGGTYAWSPTTNMTPPAGNTASVTVTPTATTTYDVTVTTAAGCSASASGTVTVNPLPTPTVNSPGMCAGTSATLTTSGGGTYAWSPTTNMTPPAGNTASVTVTPTATTTYDVTVTSAAGCSATASGTVTVNPLPTPTVNSPSICAGQSATLTTSGGGTYAWSPTTNMTPPAGNTASVTVTPGATTTYDVTVTTAAGCSASASGTVTVNTIAPPTVNNATICAGQSATLTTSGGGTYAWSPTTNMTPPAGNTASVTVTPTATTTYDVTVTTAAGCSASASGTVTVNPLPTPTVNSPGMCAGTSATLTTSGGGTYAWSPTTNMTPPAGNTASVTVTPTATTTYDVTVTSAAGCSATASGTVTVNPLPTPTVNSPSMCAGTSATLTTSGGGTYAWSPTTNMTPPAGNTASVTVTPGATTTYDVTVTTAAGCSASASGTVTVNPLPTPTVNNASICLGGSATLTATGGVSYQWNYNNSTTQSITVSPTITTTYPVTVTDGNGCSATTSGTVTVINPPSVSAASISICSGNTDSLVAVPTITGGTYSWSPGNASTQSIMVSPGATTTYTVTYVISGCPAATASPTVTVNPLPTPTVNDSTVCAGVSATLTATGGVSYQWNYNNANTSSITVTPATTTTYTVTATDANGCSATASGTVTVNIVPSISLGNTSICAGFSATLTPTVSSPGGTYLWSDNETTNTILVTPAATEGFTVTYTLSGCSSSASDVVTVNPLPVVTVSTDPALCTSTNGMAIANVSAGTPTYSYSWSAPGGTDDTLSNIAAGTYQVTVTDINGCTATASGQVSQQVSTIAVTEISQHNLRCYNDASGDIYISLSDNAGNAGTYTYTYSWSLGGTAVAGTQNLTGVQIGTYTVMVTDQFGCTGTGTWTLTQPPLLTASATGTNPECFGQSNGSATVTAAGGTPNYSYSWNSNPVQTTATASNIPSGSYTVTVTDDSLCTATASVTLTDPAQITFGPSTIVNPSCFGLTNGSAQVSPQNGIGSYRYNWSTTPADTTNPATNLAGGSYTVTATDANGCTASTTVNLVTPSQVMVIATGTNLSCYESSNGTLTASASGGTPPYNYIWSNQDNTATISGLAAAAYSVTATDANGCTASASDTLSQPSAVSEALTSVRTNCPNSADGSITAVASGGTPSFTYTLENANGSTVIQSGNTTGDFTGIGYGLYTVKATDQNGCYFSDTITVPQAPFNYYTDTAIGTTCYGSQYTNGSIELQGYSIPNGPFQYSINGGPFQISPYFFNLAAGSYQVTAQDHYGCDTTFTVVVPSPLPATVQILPGDSTITAGSTLQLTTVFGPYSTDSITGYAWSPGTGMSCIDCPSPQVSPYANQTIYTVIITYNQGCTASATVQINTNGQPPLYIPNAFTPNGDGVNDVWYVYGTGIKDIKIMVFDRWGEKVFESDDQSIGWDGTYKGKIQQPDIFIYEVNATYLDGTTISKQGSLTLIR